jgi:hypothetical protein
MTTVEKLAIAGWFSQFCLPRLNLVKNYNVIFLQAHKILARRRQRPAG